LLAGLGTISGMSESIVAATDRFAALEEDKTALALLNQCRPVPIANPN
jgi:hypothetical protein